MNTGHDSLKTRIDAWTSVGDQNPCAVPGLSLFRSERPTEPTCGMYAPSVCLVVQGQKQVALGEELFVYDPDHYLITSVHLPTVAHIMSASPEVPYLGLRLILDLDQMAQLMVDSNLPAPREQQTDRGMGIGVLNTELRDAFRRLIDLLGDPDAIPILAPVITREILYRLLVGEQGMRLRRIAGAGSSSRQIARAIEWLKSHFAQPLRVEQPAEQARMSTSTFHHHFRAMTALSPLQFQKKLRLQEARRLMLMEHLDAAGAAFEVGYESPSQFSREYNRQFGAPPLRDITRLRRLAADQPQPEPA